MVYSTNNEQGYSILTHNTEWQPKDYDGLYMMFKPEKIKKEVDNENILKKGFSKAAKYEMARYKQKASDRDIEKKTEYVILDVETTGLDYENDNIIEVGLLKIQNDEIKEQYQSYIKIAGDIPNKIKELTGITKDDIDKLGRDEKQVLIDIKTIIGDCMVIGYNVQFDVNFINRLCKKLEVPLFIKKTKDVMKDVKRKLELDNYKLETVCNYFGFERRKKHRAAEDCMLVYDILNELNKMA